MYSQWEDDADRLTKAYDVQGNIGHGAQGNVTKVVHKASGEQFSMKRIDINFSSRVNSLNVLREIKILKSVSHRNIIGLKEIFIKDPLQTYTEIFLISDLMEIDLKHVIYSPQELSMSHIKKISFQILSGLEYLHRKNIMHRDIKPANILVNKDCKVKICDFGMAKANLAGSFFDGMPFPGNSCGVTTKWYRAPEIYFEFEDYTESIDVWAFGCTLAEMLLRKPFMKGRTEKEQIEMITDCIGIPPKEMLKKLSPTLQGYFASEVSLPQDFRKTFMMLDSDGIDLLYKIFTYDYKQRISVKEILAHPFFRETATECSNSLQDILESVDDDEIDNRIFSFEVADIKAEGFRRLIYLEKGEFH